MQAVKGLEEENGLMMQTSTTCGAVQGLPWWGGVGPPTAVQAATTNPMKHVITENPGGAVGVSASLQSLSFAQPRPSSPILVQTLADGQGPPVGAARMPSWPSSGDLVSLNTFQGIDETRVPMQVCI